MTTPPTAAELRARIEAKQRTDHLAALAQHEARRAEVEATALLRLTAMIEEMTAQCSTYARTRLDANDEAEALTALARSLGYKVTTRYEDGLSRDDCGAARAYYEVTISALA